MKPVNDQEIFICSEDLVLLYRRYRLQLVRVFLLVAVGIFAFLVFKPQKYKASASFKQSISKSGQIPNEIKNFLKEANLHQQAETGAVSVMLSRHVLHQVVQELGFQIQVRPHHFLTELCSRFGKNFLREFGGRPKDQEIFEFRDVVYEGESTAIFFLRFLTNDTFEILNEEKDVLSQGRMKEKVNFLNHEITLSNAPSDRSLKTVFKLKISPWTESVESVQKKLRITTGKNDKNMLQLTFVHQNRHIAARFLNSIMGAYRNYLRVENEEIAQAQLAYLETRQEELAKKMDKTLEEHSAYLKKNLGDNGFIGLHQEIEILAVPKEHYLSRLFDLELELKRMGIAKRSFNAYYTAQLQQPSISLIDIPDTRKQASHLDGIDLETARKLHLEYNRQHQEIHEKIKELFFVSEKIRRTDFELSSLCSILHDPVSQEMVNQASALALQLQDENNRSLKEQTRLKEALFNQKQFIIQHIGHMIELSKLRVRLIEERLSSIQERVMALIKNEKKLVEERLFDIGQRMSDLPEKWRLENKLTLKAELGKSMIEGMSRLAEFKNVDHHLSQIESKPLDLAIPPLKSQHPTLFLLSLGGACFGAGVSFAFLSGRAVLKGLPATLQSLKVHHFPTAGTLSSDCDCLFSEIGDGDLETLRRIGSFIMSIPHRFDQGLSIAMVGGKNPDYSKNLASLLSMKGRKVILIQCAFDRVVHPQDIPGLWHYLQGETDGCSIRSETGFHYVPTGGTARHAPELLSNRKFADLLEEYKQNYDIVLIYSTAMPRYSDGYVFMQKTDALVVTASEETLEQLSNWSRQKGNDRVLFTMYQKS